MALARLQLRRRKRDQRRESIGDPRHRLDRQHAFDQFGPGIQRQPARWSAGRSG